jgi:hypothetical protein
MGLDSLPRLAALGLVTASAACLKVPQESASLSAMEATEVTASELQMRVYEAGRRISYIIESTADSIASRTDDPAIRNLTLRWKLAAIPLVEEASLRSDPVVAAADLWGFTMQQSEFLQRGGARDVFDDLQPLALAAADTVERLAAEVAGRIRPEGQVRPEDEEALRTWAERHPITGRGFGRESILSTNWKVLSITETSLTGTVASVQRSLAGVTNRLGYLNEGAMKRVLWQGELTAREMAPVIIDSARNALLRDLSDQQGQVFDEIDRQRVATLAEVSGERAAVLEALRGERIALLAAVRSERATVLEALRGERGAVLEAIREERIATLAAADSMAQRSIDHAVAAVGRLMLWVFVGLLALAAIVGFIALRVVRSLRA